MWIGLDLRGSTVHKYCAEPSALSDATVSMQEEYTEKTSHDVRRGGPRSWRERVRTRNRVPETVPETGPYFVLVHLLSRAFPNGDFHFG